MLRISKTVDTITPQIQGMLKAFSPSGTKQVVLAMGRRFLQQTKYNFGSGGTYRPRNWPPLSPKYAKKVGRSQATLVKTGALRNSIRIFTSRDLFVEIATTLPYAGVHQFGSAAKNIPARPFFPVVIQGQGQGGGIGGALAASAGSIEATLTRNSELEIVRDARAEFSKVSGGALPT